MELGVDYNQILSLIRQLPKNEIKKLSHTLLSEISAEKSTKSLQKMILEAPTWSDSDLNNFNDARDHMNQSRIA